MLLGPRMNPRGMQQFNRSPGFMGAPMMRPYPMHQNSFHPRPMRASGQMPQMMARGSQRSQGGGLLAKLFGKGGSASNGGSGLLAAGKGMARGASSSGGILKTLADPTAISGFLSNTQQVLKTAQQFGPMIQQYGPLVRNLPSMWRLYKGLKNMPDAEEDSGEQPTEDSKPAEEQPKKKVRAKKRAVKQDDIPASKKETNKGQSMPKLFF